MAVAHRVREHLFRHQPYDFISRQRSNRHGHGQQCFALAFLHSLKDGTRGKVSQVAGRQVDGLIAQSSELCPYSSRWFPPFAFFAFPASPFPAKR